MTRRLRATGAAVLATALVLTPALLNVPAANAAPFTIGASQILIGQEAPTQLQTAIAAGSELEFQDIGNTSHGITYNALGYHVESGYAYAIDISSASPRIMRVHSNGTLEYVSSAESVSYAGAIPADTYPNRYYYKGAGNSLHWYGVTTGQKGTITLSAGMPALDFTWMDGYFWGMHRAPSGATTMYRAHPTTGIVTAFNVDSVIDMARFGSGTSGNFGGAWTFANGNLGFTNNGGGTVQIDVSGAANANPTFTVVSYMNGPSSSNNDAAYAPGSPVDLGITKSVDVPYAAVGDQVEYTITVTNHGPGTSSGYTVQDSLPSYLTFTAASYPSHCNVIGSTLTCAEGVVNNGESRDITVRGTVNNTAASGSTVVTNRADVIGNEADPNAANNVDTAQFLVGSPQLVLDKSVEYTDSNSNGRPDLGEDITWTFDVDNSGPIDATDMVIVDPTVGTVTPESQDIASGDSATYTASGVVTQAIIDAGSVTNTAHSAGSVPTGAYTTNEDTAVLVVPADPQLTPVKAASLVDLNDNGVADVGEMIDYTITVSNSGNVTAYDITVDDSLIQVTPASVAELAPGAGADFTGSYQVTPVDVAAGTVHNVATATGDTPGGDPIQPPPTETYTPTADNRLTLVKSAVDPTMVIEQSGDIVEYRFVVTNTGNTVMEEVTVVDDLIDAGTLDPISVDSLAPNAQAIFTGFHTVTQDDIDAGGTVTNTASAAGTPIGGSRIQSPPDTVIVPMVDPSPGLLTEKSAQLVDENANGFADLGEEIQYTVTATNTGDVTLTDVTVTDPMAPAADDKSVGTLIPGQKGSYEFAYEVTQANVDAGEVHNAATSEGIDPQGNAEPSNYADTTTPTGGEFALRAVKNADLDDVNESGYAEVGEQITYTVTVYNDGDITATNVTPNDPMLGATFTPASADIAPGASQVFTFTPYTVTAEDIQAGSVDNSATASGTNPTDPDTPVESPPTTTETPTGEPGLTIVKSAQLDDSNGNDVADVGETIAFSFEVSNTGSLLLEDIAVSDEKVSGLTPALFDLPAFTTLTVTADPYTVTADDVAVGSVLNSATATGTVPGGGTPIGTPPSTTDTPTVDPVTSYTSVKLAELQDDNENGFADLGETILYTFEVTNTGTLPITGVSIADAKVGAVTPAAQDLAVGATVSFQAAPYSVTQQDVDNGSVLNQATVGGNTHGGDPIEPQYPATETPTPDPAPALVAEKSSALDDTNGNGVADEGETIVYSVNITNNGNVTLQNVGPNDPMLGDSFTPASVILTPAQSQLFTAAPYLVTPDDVANGSIRNTATGTGTFPSDPTDPDAPAVPVESPPSTVEEPTVDPGVLIEKFAELNDTNGNGLADLGETIEYFFDVSNTGNTVLENVTVTDPKVTGVTPETATVAPGETIRFTAEEYTITEADIVSGVVSNTATASGNVPGDNTPIVTPPDTVTVSPAPAAPALEIEKSARLFDNDGDNLADAGEEIEFAFVVTNTGNTTATDVSVIDPMVTGLTPKVIVTLAPGESVTVTADRYLVTDADVTAGKVYNVATAEGTSHSGDPIVSAEDSVTVPAKAGVKPEGTLPSTGQDLPWGLLGAAGGLTVLGLWLLVLTNRKRKRTV